MWQKTALPMAEHQSDPCDKLDDELELTDDFLPAILVEGRPDFLRHDFLRLGHDSYSFTSERSSSTATRESVARGP